LEKIILQKRLSIKILLDYFLCIVAYFLHAQINASGHSTLLKILDHKNQLTSEYSRPFAHDSLGLITWTDTTISILSQNPITPCDDELPIYDKEDYNSYTELKNWNNQKVNVYLIPWPKTFTKQKKPKITTDVEVLEGHKKSFIESSNFALLKQESGGFWLLISNRIKRPNSQGNGGHSYKAPFFKNQEADIFFTTRYFIICYQKKDFVIKNIAQLNGFCLNLNQRKELLGSKIYSWKYEDKPIEIEVNNNKYSLVLKQDLTKTPNPIKIIKQDSSFKKLLSSISSYKWVLFCCTIGMLSFIMIVRKLLCTIKN
jgi:hypothetical protein